MPPCLRAMAAASPPVPPPAMITRTVNPLDPEPLRRDPGALGQRRELRPAHLRSISLVAACKAKPQSLPISTFSRPTSSA